VFEIAIPFCWPEPQISITSASGDIDIAGSICGSPRAGHAQKIPAI